MDENLKMALEIEKQRSKKFEELAKHWEMRSDQFSGQLAEYHNHATALEKAVQALHEDHEKYMKVLAFIETVVPVDRVLGICTVPQFNGGVFSRGDLIEKIGDFLIEARGYPIEPTMAMHNESAREGSRKEDA